MTAFIGLCEWVSEYSQQDPSLRIIDKEDRSPFFPQRKAWGYMLPFVNRFIYLKEIKLIPIRISPQNTQHQVFIPFMKYLL